MFHKLAIVLYSTRLCGGDGKKVDVSESVIDCDVPKFKYRKMSLVAVCEYMHIKGMSL